MLLSQSRNAGVLRVKNLEQISRPSFPPERPTPFPNSREIPQAREKLHVHFHSPFTPFARSVPFARRRCTGDFGTVPCNRVRSRPRIHRRSRSRHNPARPRAVRVLFFSSNTQMRTLSGPAVSSFSRMVARVTPLSRMSSRIRTCRPATSGSDTWRKTSSPLAFGAAVITRDAQAIQFQRQRNAPEKIGHQDHAAVQDRDHRQLAVAIIVRDSARPAHPGGGGSSLRRKESARDRPASLARLSAIIPAGEAKTCRRLRTASESLACRRWPACPHRAVQRSDQGQGDL